MRRRCTGWIPGWTAGAVSLVAVASVVGLATVAGCGGGDEEPAPADVPSAPADGDAGEPAEDVEARIRAAEILERQRETLVDELVELAADGDTSARDVVMLVPADAPPRLFRMDEPELESLPAEERTAVIARYDRLALGLKELARRAADEAAAMAEAGRIEEARGLLRRVRALAEASAGDEVAEIGRDAARMAMAIVDEGMAELPEAGTGAGTGEDAGS